MPERPLHTVVRHLRRLADGPPGPDAGDHELLRRFTADRDEAAFAALLRRHGPMVRDVSRRLLGQEADVDDTVQAVFLVLACQARSVRNRQSLAGWLHGVAFRTAQRVRRDAVRRRQREARPAAQVPEDPAREAARRELCAALDAELDRLPEGERAALVLCYLEGRTRDEAAQHLGLSVRTFDRRLARGKERLRVRLERRGLTLSGALLVVGLSQNATAAGVPAALVPVTIKAATLLAAGSGEAAVAVPAEVLALTRGVLKAMLRTRLRIATVTLLALGLLGAASGLLAVRAAARGPQAQAQELAALDPARAAEPTAARPAEAPDVYALLLIEDREPQLLPEAQRPASVDGAAFRRTQLVLLKSRPVLQAALRKPEVAGLAVVRGKADPVAWLEKNLAAVFLEDSGVLRVSVAGGSAEERAALANAIANAYLEEVVGADQSRKAHRLDELDKLRGEYEDALRNKRDNLRKRSQAVGEQARSLQQQFAREDLAEMRKELQRVHLAKLRAQARLNYLKGAGAREGVKEAIARLTEETGVLAEQEKLLNAEITPLAETAQAQARAEAVEKADLTSFRDEITAAEQLVKKIVGEVGVMQVELRATPRVRLLQKAEAPRLAK
jgi:RNA polymerase sigma factor (sigma-70 family)